MTRSWIVETPKRHMTDSGPVKTIRSNASINGHPVHGAGSSTGRAICKTRSPASGFNHKTNGRGKLVARSKSAVATMIAIAPFPSFAAISRSALRYLMRRALERLNACGMRAAVAERDASRYKGTGS
jgi:hypothetical protein